MIDTGYQYRTIRKDREGWGLFLWGARVASTETKTERVLRQRKENISFDSLCYPLQNGEKLKDYFIVRTELRCLDEKTNSGRVKKNLSVQFQAEGFQFQPMFYANADEGEAIAFYKGKAVACCYLRLEDTHGMAEVTQEAFAHAYSVQVDDYSRVNVLLDPGTEEYTENSDR